MVDYFAEHGMPDDPEQAHPRTRRDVSRRVCCGMARTGPPRHRGMFTSPGEFNNTIITITDPNGNVISWGSCRRGRFQGLPQEHAICRGARRPGR